MERSPTDKSIEDLAGRVGRFERRFERFEDKVDARFNRLDGRLDKWGRMIGGGVVTVAVALSLKILGIHA